MLSRKDQPIVIASLYEICVQVFIEYKVVEHH